MARPSGGISGRWQDSPIIRWVTISALALVVIGGLGALIIWFVIRPAPFELVVDDARFSGFNLTADGRLNATFDLTIWADNGNDMVAAYYDAMQMRVVFDHHLVAIAKVAPFFQRHQNATEIRVAAVARSAPVGGEAAAKLRRERSKGKLAVRVEVRAKIRFRVARLKTMDLPLRAYCSPVDVYLSASRESGRRTDCNVYYIILGVRIPSIQAKSEFSQFNNLLKLDDLIKNPLFPQRRVKG